MLFILLAKTYADLFLNYGYFFEFRGSFTGKRVNLYKKSVKIQKQTNIIPQKDSTIKLPIDKKYFLMYNAFNIYERINFMRNISRKANMLRVMYVMYHGFKLLRPNC